jgi:hypothetical protein
MIGGYPYLDFENFENLNCRIQSMPKNPSKAVILEYLAEGKTSQQIIEQCSEWKIENIQDLLLYVEILVRYAHRLLAVSP